jgi:hypothetical protein
VLAASDAGRESEPAAPAAHVIRGRAYEGDGLQNALGKALYDISLVRSSGPNGDHLRVVSTAFDGREFLVQDIDFDRGGTPTHYAMVNSAARHQGRLEVTPTKLLIEFSSDGKKQSASVARPPVFAVGASVLDLVEAHTEDLVAGKEVRFGVAALDRLQVFDVKLERERDEGQAVPEVRAGRWIVVALKPSNGLFALFAPKMRILLDVERKKVAMVIGPMPSSEPGGGMSSGSVRYER